MANDTADFISFMGPNPRAEAQGALKMDASITPSDTATYVALGGRLTFSDHTAFRKMLDEITQLGTRKCVFNLEKLVSIDSSGLGMFVVAHEQGKQNGWDLAIEGASGHVKSLLELGKFDKILDIREAC